jgi:ketosteroid isomerase-like protein
MLYKLSLVIVITSLLGCSEKKVDTKAEAEKLMQISRDWSKDAATNNVEKIVSYWADDAVLYTGDMPALIGKPAIKEMVQHSMQMPGFKISWEPTRADVCESGDMAYLIEKNAVSYQDSTGKPMVMQGNVVTVWKKNTAGEWKAVVDITSPIKY